MIRLPQANLEYGMSKKVGDLVTLDIDGGIGPIDMTVEEVYSAPDGTFQYVLKAEGQGDFFMVRGATDEDFVD